MVHACATRVVQSPSSVLKYIKCMIGDNYSPLEAGERYDSLIGFNTIYRKVLLEFTPDMEEFCMLCDRCPSKNRKRSLKQHIKYYHFMGKI